MNLLDILDLPSIIFFLLVVQRCGSGSSVLDPWFRIFFRITLWVVGSNLLDILDLPSLPYFSS